MRYVPSSLGRRRGAAGGSEHPGDTSGGNPADHVVLFPVPHACAVSDIGVVRERNEDRCHVSRDGRLLVVADGMGGHAAGDVASELAVAAVREGLDADGSADPRDRAEEPMERLVAAFAMAHERVVGRSREVEACRNMGATLIAAMVRGDRLYTCHVGDVRAYVWCARGLQQLTDDHSVVAELVRSGHLAAEDARHHPRRHELLRAVGAGVMPPTPQLRSVDLAAGDVVLLCSDGLWDEVSPAEIEAVLSAGTPLRERALDLVERANAAGGHDNVTVALYLHAADAAR